MKLSQSHIYTLSAVTVAALLSACGGGGDEATAATPDTAAPKTCTPAVNAATGYSAVFKSCNGAVAEYFDKIECVRDNATGLVWEGKTSSGLRAGNNKYTNFDSDFQKQKGPALAAPTRNEINAIDNSVGYRNEVSRSNLCGFGNWRVPNKDELATLIAPGGTINSTWFTNTPAEPFWTSTNSVFGDNLAIIVGFANGGVGDFSRTDLVHVRLVRN